VFPRLEHKAFAERQTELLQTYHQHDGEPFVVQMEASARTLLIDFHGESDRRAMRQESENIDPFMRRWGENAWRMALGFHCAEHGARAHEVPMTEETAAAAVRVMRWFTRHQQDQRQSFQSTKTNNKLSVALSYVNRSPGGATAWDVYRFKQGLFDNVQDARTALDQLEDEGSITGEQSRKSRRFFRKPAPRTR
jgi:hypothetical protein